MDRKNDGDRRGRLLRRQDRERSPGHDDIHVTRDELGGQSREAIDFAIRRSKLDGDVLAFNITVFAQPLPECINETQSLRTEGRREITYAISADGWAPAMSGAISRLPVTLPMNARRSIAEARRPPASYRANARYTPATVEVKRAGSKQCPFGGGSGHAKVSHRRGHPS